MDAQKIEVTEETLDPQDWDAMRALGHRMLDEMFDHLMTLRDEPAWRPMPDATRARFKSPAPQQGQPIEQIYDEFKRDILPYRQGTTHPRFWGWVIGTGTPFGMLAEMLAAAMNSNLGGGDHAANEVEKQVLNWFKDVMGFPASASGLLVSGGSMANFVGLAVARNTMAEHAVRKERIQATPRRMALYASIEAHASNKKSAELLGIGGEGLRSIPVNADYQIDLDALKAAITADRAAGLYPFCVIGNAGTVNTGAFDDLNALADLCAQEKLWLHVDGAFGALAKLAPDNAHLADGLERADSLAFDLHKWMYMPYEIGCTLVRREEDHVRTFAANPEYLAHMPRGLAGGSNWFTDYGLQLSRSFRALKAWMSIKEHGLEKYGRLIQQNMDQARYLAELVRAAPELELCAPFPLNIVCFRYATPGKTPQELNALNQEILMRLHEEGIALPSYTTLNGVWAIRAAITNHRSRREDFELLAREVVRLGNELVG